MHLKSNIIFIMGSSINSIKQPNPTRIFQSPYLTDAIIDDSYSLLHLALKIQFACNQLTEKGTLPLLCLMLSIAGVFQVLLIQAYLNHNN